jgi:hypothetical protein
MDAATPVAKIAIVIVDASLLSLWTIAIASRAQTACTNRHDHLTKLTCVWLTIMRCRRASNAFSSALTISRCGTHSLGLVYEFLLKTDCNPKQARADFVMFLSGELPARLLKEAQLWVSEEQGCEPLASIEDPIIATEHAGDPFWSHRRQATVGMNQFRPAGNYELVRNRRAMHPKKFESKEALVAYVAENGLTCLLESFGKWHQQVLPEQYEVVAVQTYGLETGNVFAERHPGRAPAAILAPRSP